MKIVKLSLKERLDCVFLFIFEMAGTKNVSKKNPRLAQITRVLKGLATPVKENAPTQRNKCADLRTPDRWKIVTACFLHLMLTHRTIQRIVEKYKEQQINQLTRNEKLIAALEHAMIRVNDENWGRPSIKRLTGGL